jgi:hypothetical protein
MVTSFQDGGCRSSFAFQTIELGRRQDRAWPFDFTTWRGPDRPDDCRAGSAAVSVVAKLIVDQQQRVLDIVPFDRGPDVAQHIFQIGFGFQFLDALIGVLEVKLIG